MPRGATWKHATDRPSGTVLALESAEPVVLLEQAVEVDEVVVADGATLVCLEKLGGQLPRLALPAGGDEHVDDAGIGRLHNRHAAARTPEHVAARVGVPVVAHPEAVHPPLHYSPVTPARLDAR